MACGILLSACAGRNVKVASVKEGACKIAHTPQYAVKGLTPYDQDWIDDTTEGLVGGCAQPRPKARPASLDAKYTVGGKTVPVPVPKKRFRFLPFTG